MSVDWESTNAFGISRLAAISADLWVASSAPIPGAISTGVTSGVQYAVGAVQGMFPSHTPSVDLLIFFDPGPVQLAPLTFAGHTIPRQAFSEPSLTS